MQMGFLLVMDFVWVFFHLVGFGLGWLFWRAVWLAIGGFCLVGFFIWFVRFCFGYFLFVGFWLGFFFNFIFII